MYNKYVLTQSYGLLFASVYIKTHDSESRGQEEAATTE